MGTFSISTSLDVADFNGKAIDNNSSGTGAMELVNGVVYAQDRASGSWYDLTANSWAPTAAPPLGTHV